MPTNKSRHPLLPLCTPASITLFGQQEALLVQIWKKHKELEMLHIPACNLESTVLAINFTLRNFVPERQLVLQNMMAGEIDGLSLSTDRWHSSMKHDLTTMQARVSPFHVHQGSIPALRDAVSKQSKAAIDQLNSVCRLRCELIDVQLLVSLPNGSTKLLPVSEAIGP